MTGDRVSDQQLDEIGQRDRLIADEIDLEHLEDYHPALFHAVMDRTTLLAEVHAQRARTNAALAICDNPLHPSLAVRSAVRSALLVDGEDQQ